MSREKLGRAVRRGQIVAAVLERMGEADLQALSLAAVARRLGLVPSALYRHFKDKAEVQDAVLQHVGGRLLSNVERARREEPDPLERLHRLLSLHVGLIRESQAIPRILFSEVFVAGRTARKAKVLGMLRGFLRGIAGVIREGQASGRIRRDLDPDVAAVMFIGLFQPGAMLWMLSGGGFDITRQAERAWRLMEEALRGRTRPGRAAAGARIVNPRSRRHRP